MRNIEAWPILRKEDQNKSTAELRKEETHKMVEEFRRGEIPVIVKMFLNTFWSIKNFQKIN